jgi:biotin carboxyl carrier protein
MQRYQVVVNGNTYTVTVKSIVGNTAVVDVDGWEFQVGIGDGATMPVNGPQIAAATGTAAQSNPSAPQTRQGPPTVKRESTGKKRASALEQLGPKKAAVPQVEGKGVISAHLPGQIVEINVKVGDTVSKGDTVCKMEAMKMVNEVKATDDGTVKEILVEERQNVLENQPLMIID